MLKLKQILLAARF